MQALFSLLVDHTRAQVCLKRDQKKHKKTLPSALPDDANSVDVLKLREALDALASDAIRRPGLSKCGFSAE
jgi:hypothetical protein